MPQTTEEVFREMYARHAADVYTFALRLSGDRDEAEDITADTFARVWTSSTPIRSETVRGYLLTIARNVYLHSLRHARRREPLTDIHATRDIPPDAAAEQGDALARANEALHQLTEIDRTALLLRAVDNLSYADIAGILNISPAAARVRVHRARLRLAGLHRNEEQ